VPEPIRRVHALPCLALAVLLIAPATRADGPVGETHRSGVSTRLLGRELHVAAKLLSGLPPDVAERLGSGLPTTVLWRIRLFVFNNLWLFDSLKDERRYEVTATYRPVPGDYLVEKRLDDRLLGTRVLPAKAEALEALSEVPDLPLFILGSHLEGRRLVVRVRCAYARGVSLGVVPTTVETDWVRSGIFDWPPPNSR
jgi:hypothetical protein